MRTALLVRGIRRVTGGSPLPLSMQVGCKLSRRGNEVYVGDERAITITPTIETFTILQRSLRFKQIQIDRFAPRTGTLSPCGELLQRVRFIVIGRDGSYGSRINTSSLRKGEIFHSVPMK